MSPTGANSKPLSIPMLKSHWHTTTTCCPSKPIDFTAVDAALHDVIVGFRE